MRRHGLVIAITALVVSGFASTAQALPAHPTSASFTVGGVNDCAITGSGNVRCWGYSDNGQTTTPTSVSSATAVTVGNAHICALNSSGSVVCWGANEAGQTNVPTDLAQVTAIDAGDRHTCAITSGGTVRCWGLNDAGQVTVPADLASVDAISAGGATSCALRAGSVLCWGDNSEGQATPPVFTAQPVAVSVGGLHACALLSDGSVVCWGNNDDGQATVPAGLAATSISAGDAHTCAVTTAATVVCWGNNFYKQTAVPAGLKSVAVVSAGAAHTCAATTDGAVRCWGNNDDGEGQTTVPDAPANVTATSGNASVTVTWQAPDFDGASPITGYLATASTGQSCSTTASGTTCIISGLANGTAVNVVVRAANANGSGIGATSATVTPNIPLTPPPAPTGVVALPAASTATVLWTAPTPAAGVTISGYVVTAQPGAVTCTSKASPCKFGSLTAGVDYTFTVAAQSNAGVGTSSAPAYATVAPFAMTITPGSLKANGAATFNVSGAPDGAVVALTGGAKASGTAGRDGKVSITATIAKTGAVTATTTVAKTAYKVVATAYVPVVKSPTSATAGKALTYAVSAARPGSTATLTTDSGVTLTQTVAANGAAALTFTPSAKGAVAVKVNVDGVDLVSSTVTVK